MEHEKQSREYLYIGLLSSIWRKQGMAAYRNIDSYKHNAGQKNVKHKSKVIDYVTWFVFCEFM